MVESIVWAIVVLVIAGVAIWRTERFFVNSLRGTAKDPEITLELQRLELQERRNRLDVETDTLQASIALKNAQLEGQTAETKAATARLESLQDVQLEADKTVIEARRQAACKLAEEFVRSDQQRSLSPDELLEAYERYLGMTADEGRAYAGLETFIKTVRSA